MDQSESTGSTWWDIEADLSESRVTPGEKAGFTPGPAAARPIPGQAIAVLTDRLA